MKDYLTVEQVADQLVLHPKTVRRYIREGQLPAQRVGKAYRIAPAAVYALLGEPEPAENNPTSVQVSISAQLDIRGVTEATATDLTRHIMAVKSAPAPCHMECRFLPDAQGGNGVLKVLLFGTTDYTEQMLKHINLSIARLGLDVNLS